jgi:hypothetical protein
VLSSASVAHRISPSIPPSHYLSTLPPLSSSTHPTKQHKKTQTRHRETSTDADRGMNNKPSTTLQRHRREAPSIDARKGACGSSASRPSDLQSFPFLYRPQTASGKWAHVDRGWPNLFVSNTRSRAGRKLPAGGLRNLTIELIAGCLLSFFRKPTGDFPLFVLVINPSFLICITGRSEVGTPAFLKFWYKIL